MAEKRCSVCKEIKDVSCFGLDPTKHSKDDYKGRCKICERDLMRLYRRNRAKEEGRELRLYPTDYQYDEAGNCIARRCSICKEIKPASEFTKDPKRKTGITHRCKVCKAAIERRPERMNSESHNNSRRNHSLLKKGCTIHHTDEQWVELVRLTGNVCLFPGCNCPSVTRDHIIPLSRGGNDEIDNIQPLCLSHNGFKKDLLIIDYRPLEARFWAFMQVQGEACIAS